jgi:hypothetical protein
MTLPIIMLGITAFIKRQISFVLVLVWIILPGVVFLVTSIGSVGNAHVWGGMSILAINILIILFLVRNTEETRRNNKIYSSYVGRNINY